ncbi:MAG: tRNA epoxyqueuosine(34) reductase QueG [Betaproteobacteria bacterium]
MSAATHIDLAALARDVKSWGRSLGFGAVGISDIDTAQAMPHLAAWLAQGRHGDMDYMARHAPLRADPQQLLPRAARVISARLDYRPRSDDESWLARETSRLADGAQAVVSIYARGRDYHKVLRQRLQHLATRIETAIGHFGYRVCTDSAPVLEVEFARKAGLGWRGKHTLLLTQEAGSMFFLGEILVDLPLPVDAAVSEHCGNCTRCIEACPTGAITGPYQLDARRCISYLTIEHTGSIAPDLRPLLGNRVYGCDDCQLACPWNKFAQVASLPDFEVRHGLDSTTLIELFAWTEVEFGARHAGSAIRRIGHERWLRNIAVALGNAPTTPAVIEALRGRAGHPSALVREHVRWALERHADRTIA